MRPGMAGVFVALLDRVIEDMDDDELDRVADLRAEAQTLAKDLAAITVGLIALTDQEHGASGIVGSSALPPTFSALSHIAENIGAMLDALEAVECVKRRRHASAAGAAHSVERASHTRHRPQQAATAGGGAA